MTAMITTVGVSSTSEALRRLMFDDADDVGLILLNQLKPQQIL